jgi:hypothetical protein
MASFQFLESSAPGRRAEPAERRAERRLFWPGTAVIHILPYGPDVLGVLLDVSETGCGVEFGIGIPAQVGAQVEVELNVRGVTLARMGIIRYIDVIRHMERETRAGIEFMEPKRSRAPKADRAAKGVVKRIDRDLKQGG